MLHLCGIPFETGDIINLAATGVAAIGIGVLIWQSVLLRQSINDAKAKEARELRAYLHICEEKIPGLDFLNKVLDGATHIKLTETVIYHFEFKNFGQTPAHEVFVDVRTVVDQYPVIPEARSEWEKLEFRKDLIEGMIFSDTIYDGTLGPEGASGIQAHLSKELTPDEIFLLNKGEDTAIYIYGHIEYQDVFSKDRRVTNFCFSHRKKKGEDKFRTTLETWLEGNKAT